MDTICMIWYCTQRHEANEILHMRKRVFKVQILYIKRHTYITTRVDKYAST